jgi:hypothetical protein
MHGCHERGGQQKGLWANFLEKEGVDSGEVWHDATDGADYGEGTEGADVLSSFKTTPPPEELPTIEIGDPNAPDPMFGGVYNTAVDAHPEDQDLDPSWYIENTVDTGSNNVLVPAPAPPPAGPAGTPAPTPSEPAEEGDAEEESDSGAMIGGIVGGVVGLGVLGAAVYMYKKKSAQE